LEIKPVSSFSIRSCIEHSKKWNGNRPFDFIKEIVLQLTKNNLLISYPIAPLLIIYYNLYSFQNSGIQLQYSGSDIDLYRISSKGVVSFVQNNRLYRLKDFADLESFSRNHPDFENFYQHRKTFSIQKPVEEVWDAYKNIPPKQAWCGNMFEFGLQYCRKQNIFIYADDEYKGAAVGQIVLICVKILGGLVMIAVGHEITAVNDEDRMLETCYLLKGKAMGSQQIRLKATKEGFTEITHHTIYKSDSKFRDKVLYPFLHTKAILAFHGNIRHYLMKKSV
jgi:hypothetical protein